MHRSHTAHSIECPHLVDGSVEEGPVVTDDDGDARPVVEQVLERTQRVEIEIVGRFVEQEHVGLLDEREQQLEPSTFATAEGADGCELGVTVEPEPSHQRQVLERRLPLVAGDRITHPLGEIECSAELVVVADVGDGGTHVDTAGCRDAAGAHEIEQRRLPRPVGTDDADPVAGLELHRHPFEHTGAIGPGERDVAQLDAFRSEALAAHRQGEVAGTRRGVGPRLDERRGGRDPRLSAWSCAPGPTPQPRELVLRQVPTGLLGGLGLRLSLGPTVEVGGIPGTGVPPSRDVEIGRAAIESSTLFVTRSSTWRSWVTIIRPPR